MKITNFLEGDSAICASECRMMNKNSPAALRTSNMHFAKKDRLWRLAVRKQRKRRVALRKEWTHFSKKDLLRRLSIPKDSRVAVRKERKRKYILATTKEDRFANLPEEITKEIMGRLPIMSVMTCKCVLKSWHHLIEGDDFGMSYTPKPGLNFIYRDMEMGYTVCDEALKPLFRFASPSHHQSSTVNHRVAIASANGLLSMWDPVYKTLFICNPMTREYVELPPLSKDIITRFFGFGMSKLSGQYKILYGDSYSSCHAYTLGRGTGLWRSVAAAAPGICRQHHESALFYNGNLHWLTSDPEKKFLVCCFDLEAEVFTSFSAPCDYSDSYGNNRLYILEGRLCLCNILDWRRVIIWKMNNYGDENSWIKEYSFNLPRGCPYLYVLEVLTNGDLLFAIAGTVSWSTSHDQLFIYSKNTEAIVTYATYAAYGSLEQPYSSNIVVYTPSLISLTTMGFHNVQPLSLLNKHADWGYFR